MGRKRVRLEQIPIHHIAVAMVHARPINAWPHLPSSRTGESQVINQIVQVFIVYRIGDAWIQHGIGDFGCPKDSSAMAPAQYGLIGMGRVKHHVHGIGSTADNAEHQENIQQGRPNAPRT